MVKPSLVTFVFALFLITSCKESNDPYETHRILYVDVNKNDTVAYFTTISTGGLSSVEFEQQANHYRISEVYLDPKELITVYHRYAPELDFVGKDSILLKNEDHGKDSWKVLGIERVKVVFDVK